MKIATIYLSIYSLLFLSYPQVGYSGLSDTVNSAIGNKVQKAITKKACKYLNKGSLGIAGEIGCEAIHLGLKDPVARQNLINIVLMLTMVVSLANSKCSVTSQGKKYRPKSYTANITHWIHKLAALIFLYADFQNTIKILKIYKKLQKEAKGKNQTELMKLQRIAMEEQLDSYKDKEKLLKISTMALGAASAVETGLTASFLAWGTWVGISDVRQCTYSKAALLACASPTNVANVSMTKASMMENIQTRCAAYYKNILTASTLIKTAREEAVKGAVKQISKYVKKSLSGNAKGQNILAQATGNVLGEKASGYLNSEISDGIKKMRGKGDSDGKNLKEVYEDTKSAQCVQDGIKAKVNDWLEEGAAAAALAGAAAFPISMPPFIAASCAIQTKAEYDRCRCALRQLGGLKATIARYGTNVKLPERMAQETSPNQFNGELHIKGVKDSEKVCGIDYTTWAIRHDLECKPLLESSSVNPTNIKEILEKELMFIGTLDIDKIENLLSKQNKNELVKYLSNGDDISEDYEMLNPEEKSKIDGALGFLGQSIVNLRKVVINEANASNVKISNQSDLFSEMGINAAGMLLVAAMYKPVSEMITILHRAPLRRAILFFTSYSIASSNVKQTAETIKDITEDLGQINSLIKKFDKFEAIESRSSTEQFEDFFQIIPKAHAAVDLIKRPRVCFDGDTLDTECNCLKTKNGCNYPISIERESELYSNKSIARIVKSQTNMIKKMNVGKVNNPDIDIYHNTLSSVSKDLNPLVASRNLDYIGKGMGYKKFDIPSRSKKLIENLTTKAYASANTSQNMKSISKREKTKKLQDDVNDQKEIKIEKQELDVDYEKRDKQEADNFDVDADMANRDIKVDDIEQDKDKNIFKIINNRYRRVWSSDRLDKD